MNIPELTDNTLTTFHAMIREALNIDDETPPGQPRRFEVRENNDFRRFADEFEREMDRREIEFDPIDWTQR